MIIFLSLKFFLEFQKKKKLNFKSCNRKKHEKLNFHSDGKLNYDDYANEKLLQKKLQRQFHS